MKLITKITLWQVGIAMLIFLVGGLATYLLYKQQITKETDYSLQASLYITHEYLKRGIAHDQLVHKRLRLEPVALPADTTAAQQREFSDTLIFHRPTQDLELYRRLNTHLKVNRKWYDVEMVTVIIEDQDVIETVSLSILLLFGSLSLATLLVNLLISDALFRPFYRTLRAIRRFELGKVGGTTLPRSRVREFAALNTSLEKLMQQSQREYRTLKEFSENASHELQTPLALARSKLDLLVQSPRLSEQELRQAAGIYEAINKLARLGQALTLLAKIDNHEFRPGNQATNLREKVERSLQAFEELIQLRSLHLEASLEPAEMSCHPALTDILVSNLLQNAIRHNEEGGKLLVQLRPGTLVVANSGRPLPFPETELFERFKKNRQNQDSIGLGLAIVRKICDTHGFGLDYGFEAGLHRFVVRF
jgi:signal transduction histidine kinase